MGIQLGTSRTSTPSVKLRSIGDKVVVAVVNVTEVPWIEYGTNQPKVGKDGKPRTQDRLVGLVVSGNGVVADGEGEREVRPGELVALYMAGHNRWEFIDGKNRLGRPLTVGDVMQWKYDRDEKGMSANAKKVRTCAIRPASDKEADQVARCEQLHMQLRSETSGQTAAPAAASAGFDDEPF